MIKTKTKILIFTIFNIITAIILFQFVFDSETIRRIKDDFQLEGFNSNWMFVVYMYLFLWLIFNALLFMSITIRETDKILKQTDKILKQTDKILKQTNEVLTRMIK